MSRPYLMAVGGASALLLALPSMAAAAISIGAYSQKAGSESATVGGSIAASSGTPSHPGATGGGEGGAPLGGSSAPGEASSASSESSQTTPGRESRCVSAGQSAVSPCYGVVTVPSGSPAPSRSGRPPVNPAAIALSLASRMSLVAGRIAASPSAHMAGLTGAASWFWLEPVPSTRSLSISLAGESVMVSATPATVRWSFGDGAQLIGGPGAPYRPGPAASGAVLHAYRTRCLPGDQGHDPYVLASCGADGYRVSATVGWSISYQASGPVTASGVLPSRLTSTSTSYPVSEARAFLTSGTGAR